MASQDYRKKMITPEKAASLLAPGDHLGCGAAAGEPTTLLDALYLRACQEDLSKCALHSGLQARPIKLFTDPNHSLQILVGFATRPTWANMMNGKFDGIPLKTYSVGQNFSKCDYIGIAVAPPNQQGFCNLGPFCFHMPGAVRGMDYDRFGARKMGDNGKKIVIAEIIEDFPIIMGHHNWFHESEIDYFIDSKYPILEVPNLPEDPIQKKIGENVGTLINDGDCFQVGVGEITEQVAKALTDKNDLSVWTEVCPKDIFALLQNGNVNGKYRETIPGVPIIAGCAFGNKELYEKLDHNPKYQQVPIEITNAVTNVSKISNFKSVIGTLEIDLRGFVNSEELHGNIMTGLGGQLDFAMGAWYSKGGSLILTLPSTKKDPLTGKVISAITPRLQSNMSSIHAAIVTNVVTEYGIANLELKSHSERARALIEIAHPDHRDWLMDEAKKMFPYM